jgi:plastocyanin
VRRLTVVLTFVTLALVAAASASVAPALAGVKRQSARQPPVLHPVFPAGVERLHYRYGPMSVAPGTNVIGLASTPLPHPNVDGYVVGLVPSMVLPGGKAPSVDKLHMHHMVWLNSGAPDITSPGLPYQRFFASGEEKTRLYFPAPYGYPTRASDRWMLNYMIHNLTTKRYTVYIDYELDFVPAGSALASTMRPARPVWMDVQNGNAYPVFNVLRGSGSGGSFTFPDQARNPYGAGPPLNQWTVDRPSTIIETAGHLHPGGLHDDLKVMRPGVGETELFRSNAFYWEPRGPISWDMAMTATSPDYRVTLQPGDVLKLSATYETRRASWYESMGIMVVWLSDEQTGVNPFATHPDMHGVLTHGRLPENIDHGGTMVMPMANPATLPSAFAPHNTVTIAGFNYYPGGAGIPGAGGHPPAIKQGQSLTFENLDPARTIFHTVTDCSAPCNLNGGISFPLANGPEIFDSGQLGYGPAGFTAAANRTIWHTPTNLPPGTYTYFCRIHPFMRGSFRVLRAH